MNKTIKNSLAGLLASTIIASAAFAAGTHPETGEALADDQTFVYRVLDEHSSVDPQVVEDTDGADIVRDLFEGLMNQDEDGNLVPGVATGFEVNDTKDVYIFTLRDEAKWSNGDPVTAGDFVYAWKRAVDPELSSPYAWFMELMSIENAAEIIAGEKPVDELGVKAIDDKTLEDQTERTPALFPADDHALDNLPCPAESHRRVWRCMDQAREHRLERRICSDRAPAQGTLGARAQRDVLGQRQHHHRQGRGAGHQ